MTWAISKLELYRLEMLKMGCSHFSGQEIGYEALVLAVEEHRACVVPWMLWLAIPCSLGSPTCFQIFFFNQSETRGEVVKTCVNRTALDPVLLLHEGCEWKFSPIGMHLKLLEEPDNPQAQTLPLDSQEQPWEQKGQTLREEA